MTDSPVQVLSTLDAVSLQHYDQAEAYVMSVLRAKFPDRDFGYGRTLYWTAVVPLATGMAAMRTNTDILWRSLYLRTMRDEPALVDADLGAALLENYYQSLASGNKSTGSATIVVRNLTTYSIPAGTRFTVGSTAYVVTTSIFAYATADETSSDTDRVLVAQADGTYTFDVPVESETTGINTFIPKDTALTLEAPPTSYVSSRAATDIAGGTNDQTLTSKLAETAGTFAAQTFASRTHVSAMIAAQYPGTLVSLTGMGSPEMTRDTHNLLGIQTGGMVDLWCSTQPTVETVAVDVVATLTDKTRRLWSMAVPSTHTAGTYTCTAVTPAESATALSPSAVVRGFAVANGAYDPRITTATEAAFSAYQTLRVEVVDTTKTYGGLAVGDTATYRLTLLRMPLVQSIQDWLVDGRLTSADRVLVRGAVPCVTAVAMKIRLLDSDYEADIDTDAMRTAIVNRIRAVGFGYGTLSASGILDAVHGYITGRSDVGTTTVTLSGTVYAPTGDVLFLRGQEIVIPDLPDKQVTKSTAVFSCAPTAVTFSFERVSA